MVQSAPAPARLRFDCPETECFEAEVDDVFCCLVRRALVKVGRDRSLRCCGLNTQPASQLTMHSGGMQGEPPMEGHRETSKCRAVTIDRGTAEYCLFCSTQIAGWIGFLRQKHPAGEDIPSPAKESIALQICLGAVHSLQDVLQMQALDKHQCRLVHWQGGVMRKPG